jgi:crotonobetainyl-CoA:carnitine CoA-transferase CaiB-like acyl-CoA transferase
VARTGELDRVIGDWCAAHDLDHVLKVLADAQVPSGKIYDIADIVGDLQYRARGMIEQARLADGSEMKVPGVVPKLMATPGGTRWLGPKLGEHTREVLAELGYDESRIAALKARNII